MWHESLFEAEMARASIGYCRHPKAEDDGPKDDKPTPQSQPEATAADGREGRKP